MTTVAAAPKRARPSSPWVRAPGAQRGERVGDAERADRDEHQRGDAYLGARHRVGAEHAEHRDRRQQHPQEALEGWLRLAQRRHRSDPGEQHRQHVDVGARVEPEGRLFGDREPDRQPGGAAQQSRPQRRLARRPGAQAGDQHGGGERGDAPVDRLAGRFERAGVDVAHVERLHDQAVPEVGEARPEQQDRHEDRDDRRDPAGHRGEQPAAERALLLAASRLQRPGSGDDRAAAEQLERDEGAHPAFLQVRPHDHGRHGEHEGDQQPAQPAAAVDRLEDQGRGQHRAADRVGAEVDLGHQRRGEQGAGGRPEQRRAPPGAVDGDEHEAGEQQDEQAVRVHRLGEERVEDGEGGDHPGEAERQPAAEPLAGEAEDEARRDPDEDRHGAAAVGGEGVAAERREAAEELEEERPVGGEDVGVEGLAVGEGVERDQHRALVVVAGEAGEDRAVGGDHGAEREQRVEDDRADRRIGRGFSPNRAAARLWRLVLLHQPDFPSKRSSGTRQAASATIERSIFDVPAWRSRKTIGTSTTLKPRWIAR